MGGRLSPRTPAPATGRVSIAKGNRVVTVVVDTPGTPTWRPRARRLRRAARDGGVVPGRRARHASVAWMRCFGRQGQQASGHGRLHRRARPRARRRAGVRVFRVSADRSTAPAREERRIDAPSRRRAPPSRSRLRAGESRCAEDGRLAFEGGLLGGEGEDGSALNALSGWSSRCRARPLLTPGLLGAGGARLRLHASGAGSLARDPGQGLALARPAAGAHARRGGEGNQAEIGNRARESGALLPQNRRIKLCRAPHQSRCFLDTGATALRQSLPENISFCSRQRRSRRKEHDVGRERHGESWWCVPRQRSASEEAELHASQQSTSYTGRRSPKYWRRGEEVEKAQRRSTKCVRRVR